VGGLFKELVREGESVCVVTRARVWACAGERETDERVRSVQLLLLTHPLTHTRLHAYAHSIDRSNHYIDSPLSLCLTPALTSSFVDLHCIWARSNR